MIQNTLFVTQKTLFDNNMTQNTLLSTVEKIITGEHDPRSPQNWRTSSDFWSPALITAI